ncbi:MAG TPA: hypothetical protein GXX51_01305 [Firmicutes bacterium]|nr:hypothetical protein [Bacillota bacterium]
MLLNISAFWQQVLIGVIVVGAVFYDEIQPPQAWPFRAGYKVHVILVGNVAGETLTASARRRVTGTRPGQKLTIRSCGRVMIRVMRAMIE